MSQEMPARPDGSALDRNGLGDMRRSGAIAGMMGVSFVWGFATEILGANGEFWLLILTTILPWALLLAVALAAFVKSENPADAIGTGLLLGSAAAVLLMLGSFLPFPLALGGRDLGEVGQDFGGWFAVLKVALVLAAVGGAVVGTVSGATAWMLNFVLSRKL